MDDWSLFGIAWVAMALAAVVLALPGVLVVARGQIILAIAASQSAACGAAAAMFLIGVGGGVPQHGDWRTHAGALCGGLLGTGLAWQGSAELAGWLFAAASAGTVLLVANSPYGMHDIMALQHSNVLTASLGELLLFAVLLLASVLLVAWQHRALRLLAIDPDHAARCGLQPRLWQAALGGWLGLVLSLAVSSFGLLASFCWLVLPTMIAGKLSTTLWPILLLAPLLALSGTVAGIALGHGCDLPPGQTIAAVFVAVYAILATALPLAKRCRRPG